MALDISKLKDFCAFDFDTHDLGRIHCNSIDTKAMNVVREAIKSDMNGPKLARLLLSNIGEKVYKTGSTKPITDDDIKKLSEEDLESFSKNFLSHNKWLLYSYDQKKRADLSKTETERESDYLIRVFRYYFEKKRKQFEKLADPYKDLFGRNILSNTAADVLKKNMLLSDRLGGSIASIQDTLNRSSKFEDILSSVKGDYSADFGRQEGPRLPNIPENPIQKTNDHLTRVIDRMDDLTPLVVDSAKLINSMNDTSVQLMGAFKKNVKRSEFVAKIAIFIALITLLVTASFSYLSYQGGKEQASQNQQFNEDLKAQVRALGDTQQKSVEHLVKELANQSAEEKKALLNYFIEVLKSEQLPVKHSLPTGSE